MTDGNTEIYDGIEPQGQWKRIAIDVEHLPVPVASKIFRWARNKQWQLISTVSFSGHLPPNFGVIGAITGRLPTDAEVRDLVQRGIPTVRIGRWPHPEDPRVPAVLEDRPAYGRLAAEHFAKRDFKHVAYIGAKPWQPDRALYEAFAQRAGELGCQCHLLQIDIHKHSLRQQDSRNRWTVREKLVADWLHSLPMPIGLVVSGDGIADRYCHWIFRARLRVPEDVAVLGVGNNSLICEPAVIPISSIEPDRAGIAANAVRLLDRLMAGEKPAPANVMVSPLGVVTRQSTDILAVSDPRVALALRIIWRHVTDDISVDWIANQVGVSRRTLERAFKNDLNRGIHQELRRRRLETACSLLLHSNQPIGDISDTLNFSSHQYFCQAFRTAYGLSPAKYSRQLP